MIWLLRHNRIGRLFGIPVEIHGTWLIVGVLFAWIGYSSAVPPTTPALAAAASTLTFVALLLSIGVHEAGHALVALRLGVPVYAFRFSPLVSGAYVDSVKLTPRHEMAVAAAGPLVNIAVGAIAFGLHALAATPERMDYDAGLRGPSITRFLADLVFANAILGIANLIPAFPMDGGRILRAALATRMPMLPATERAVRFSGFLLLGISIVCAAYVYIPGIIICALVYVMAQRDLLTLRARTAMGFSPSDLATLLHAAAAAAQQQRARAEPRAANPAEDAAVIDVTAREVGPAPSTDTPPAASESPAPRPAPPGKKRVVIWGQEHWVDDSGVDPEVLKRFFDVRPEEPPAEPK